MSQRSFIEPQDEGSKVELYTALSHSNYFIGSYAGVYFAALSPLLTMATTHLVQGWITGHEVSS